MKDTNRQIFKKSALCIALSSALTVPTYAYEEAKTVGIERIQVTASRRASTVQEAPLNITALDGDVMKDQNIGDLGDIARFVPGLSIPEQGARGGNSIIVRGLNTNSTGPSSDGGTVATYFGEMPLEVDVRLVDVERVEVLIGPQGTLYGAGSLGGAIRYIPKKAELDITSFSFSADAFSGAESDSLGGESNFVLNIPLINDELAVRASVNYYNDPGFIDYNYVVKEGGVSNPDNLADLRQVKDANGEKVVTSRIALRWMPNDWFDGTLTYLHQTQDVEGRSISNYRTLGAGNPLRDLVGKYDNAARYLEPEEDTDSLISLEMKMDLGFAELVSATGYSENENLGQRDQSDLLLRNPWNYETFPEFSAFTRESGKSNNFTQEIRLVSQSESDLSWIVGGYYNKSVTDDTLSEEYTPHYAAFAGSDRADDLEYLQFTDGETVEKALFGELSYQINEKLNVTVGARFYEYEIKAGSAFSTALWNWKDDLIGNTLVFKPNEIKVGEPDIIRTTRTSSDGNGSLFKFNANYKFTPEVMGYVTVSEGFRLGGTNGIAACTEDDFAKIAAGEQQLCATPEEFAYNPDSTTNYELGFKSTWFNNQFHFNAALFNIDWEDAQVGGATTENGGLPYTTNAGTANSKGVEISSRAMLSDSLTAFATYAYAKAELTADVPGLFSTLDIDDPAYLEYSAEDGDRLPGAPETQFTLGLNYSTEIFDDKILDIIYGITYQSDIVTSAGLKAEGETLSGYALSNFSATVSGDAWSATLYVDNLFDKYAAASTRSTGRDIGVAEFPNQIGNPDTVDLYRAYGHYVIAPRTIGIKFNYFFDM
ncbi:MAG: iron complex outermembrane receptor protein [Alteromonadaceae bacterium]|jgi:iron complex outermembrane receptor protein